ncbi:MAG: dihydroneopterin triphosphate 2'-epimerase [Xanthomonadales bacterium]
MLPAHAHAPDRATARLPEAEIKVSNLRLRTFIGFNREEREKKQDVVINLWIRYRLDTGVFEDRVDDALDYKKVTKAVIERVENGRFLLLEKLVAEILAIGAEHPAVTYCRVTVDKPHALRFADSVSLSLDYHSEATEWPQPLENVS